MSALWERPAELMLDRRDRFTRPKIAREFEQFSEQKERLLSSSIVFDPDNAGYLTPVADHTYSVVWYLQDDQPVVHAVVPTARFKRGSNLKQRLAAVLRDASDNEITLK